jgi:hypothetical protein
MTTERREGYPGATGMTRRERRLPETKTFALTSEFWVFVVAVAGMFFAAYVLDDVRNATGWRFAAFLAIAYIVSRGIAKAGSRRSYEPDWRNAGYGYGPAAEDEWMERRTGAVSGGTTSGSVSGGTTSDAPANR